MGKGIFYCHVCGDRILQADFESGRAAVVLKRNYCRKCSKAVKSGTSQVPSAPAVQRGTRQTRRIPVARQKETHPKLSRTQLVIVVAVGVIILLVLVVFVASRTSR